MNKFVVSVGLAASGAMAFNMAGTAQSLLTGENKIWNVSSSFQGFYDSNYNIGAQRQGSWGFQFSPTITATIPLTQTQIGFLYTYGLQWYAQRASDNVNAVDQQHTVNLWIDHAFNERYDLKVSDVFNSGQEPELLSSGSSGSAGTIYRVNGNNIANNALVTLNSEWTREFSTALIYANNFYDYQSQPYAGQLNRVDNSPELDLQWHLTPETMLFVGYQFMIENYLDGSVIANYGPTTPTSPNGIYDYYSDSRDNLNHFGYVGAQMNLLPNLVFAGKVGVQYYETINNPVQNTSDTTPYADLSLIYTYQPGCNAQLGFTQSRNATDVVSVDNTESSNYSLTQDLLSSSVYASINHQLTPKLMVTAIGRYTSSQFNGGEFNNQWEDVYSVGVSANYAFTKHFSGQAGYNYDDVSAPEGSNQSYLRNRVYFGFAVAY